MKYEMKRFSYRCRCGYSVSVFIDFGVPQESIRCRKCSTVINRSDD